MLAAWVSGADTRPGSIIAWGLSLSLLAVLILVVREFLILPLRPWRRAREMVRNIEGHGEFANVLVAAEEADRLPERWGGTTQIRAELKRRLYERADGILDLLGPGQVLILPRAGGGWRGWPRFWL